MSEFQMHEWQTIDRLLTPEEVSAVDDLSSHITVSSSKAVVTYHWSSFRHDPREVLLQYFDAYFYQANWGSRRLMFRFPTGLLDKEALQPYLNEDGITLSTSGKYDVLDIDFSPDDGGDWGDAVDADLSDFISLRSDLLDGDYRLLYLAWLATQAYYGLPEYDEDEDAEEYDLEPPVPPGLKHLTPALEIFAQVFGCDPFVVQAAAEASPDLRQPVAPDTRALIARLPRSECDDYLARLAEGYAGVRLSLRNRLRAFLPKETAQPAKPRPLQRLLKRAEQLEKAEQERQAAEARRKFIAEMNALAQKEPQVWQQVDDLLAHGRRIASVYDEATALLENLNALANYQGSGSRFTARIQSLASTYASRPSLIERWKKHGWL